MLKQTLNKGISTPMAIGIVLMLVIIVGTFTWLQYGEMWRESTELSEIELLEKESELSREEREKKKAEIINEAKEILEKTENIDEGVEKCKTLEWEWEYSECVANLAIIKEDSSICKDFVVMEEGTSGYIRYLCYERFAVETNDISVCALVESWSFKEKCYTIMAVKNNDKSICNLIEEREDFGTKYSRDMCPNYVGRDTVEELLGIY